MADSVVKVNFLGDESDLAKSAKAADEALAKVEQASKDTDDALEKLSKGDPLDKVKESTEDLDRALKKTKKSSDDVDESLDKVGKTGVSSMSGVAKGAIGLAAGAGLVSVGQDLLNLGTQLDVIDKKAKTVFEGSAGTVEAWAKKNASSFGQTDDQLKGLAANFGDLLKPMGFTAEQAAAMSTDVVGLSGALSAWSGGTKSAADVSQILAKAMLGERDGLKELGISISEADVQARLLKNGQDKLTGAQLEQAKATATQRLIFEKSTDAQAAWANGSMDGIKAQNALKERVAELREQIAARLLPAFQAVTKFIVSEVIPAVQGISQWIKEHKEIVIGVAAAIAVGLVAAFISWAAAAGAAAVATIAATLPIIAIGVAIAALVAGIIYAYEHWGWFRTAVDAVASFITDKLVPAFKRIGEFVVDVGKKVVSLAQTFAEWVVNVWTFGGQVVDFMQSIPGKIANAFKDLAEIILAPFKKGFEEVLMAYEKTIGRIPGLGLGGGSALANAAASDPRFAGLGAPSSVTANINIDGTNVSKAMIDLDRRFN